jgi:hypothetical protein
MNIIGVNEFFLDRNYNYSVETQGLCSLYRISKLQFNELFE